ncbi:ATP-binding protein, partial [Streptomyces clavuligerus]|uniref:ATP-binding protein n=1 Tax=Streptomyces clavuligerus TaxID=1901 RepID=UPI003F68575F
PRPPGDGPDGPRGAVAVVSPPPGGPGHAARPVPWWPPAAVLAAVASGAVLADRYTAAGSLQILAAACAALAALTLVWALSLLRLLRAERALRTADRRTAAARGAEVERLAAVRLPAIAERLRPGGRPVAVPGPLAPAAETGERFAHALATVVDALASQDAVRRERALRDSVQNAFESVARNVHAMATVQQQVLDRVERSIEDPALMAEVMKADHAAAQMTRKAQTLLVMCGVWPTRREAAPVSLYDCVRGAQSRIVEFTRIEVHGGQNLYAAPPAVEALMHAIAELLENATAFSPAGTRVVVTVREVGAGAVVEIDDAGVGMPPDVLRQATARLRDERDLARLGSVPRLGLACVGRWMRQLGFNVELTGASAYGGTRAVTFVPHRLLTEAPAGAPGPGLPRRTSRRQAGPDDRPGAGAPVPYGAAVPYGGGAEPYGPGGEPYGVPPGHGAATMSAPVPVAVPVPPDTPQHAPAYQEPFPVRGGGDGRPPPTRQPLPPEQPGPAVVDGVPGALPRRRSRRGAAVEAAARTALSPEPPEAPAVPGGRAVWTPEAARASIASVVSGSRRGRAAVAGEFH